MFRMGVVVEDKFDFVIIGAGVIGISIGIALLESSSNKRVLIQEKEGLPSSHASGRNSGVLHAGFYYSPDSLKAKFCSAGNAEVSKLCQSQGIPILRTGKIIVSQNDLEDKILQDLLSRGVENGVNVELLDAKHLKKLEPLAKTNGMFLWSPTTSVVDVATVNSYLLSKFLALGGQISYGAPVQLEVIGNEMRSLKGPQGNFYINAAGAGAIKLAQSVGVAKDYSIFPVLGLYYINRSLRQNPMRLVYPVPHPTNAFLGVHTTITMEGFTKIGPTAIPTLGIEQYELKNISKATELKQVFKSMRSMSRHKLIWFSKVFLKEFKNHTRVGVLAKASQLVPHLAATSGWEKYPSGIRAQLVHIPTGELEQDFVVELELNSIHVLNAVSPGWTSALPFGRWIASKVLEVST